MLGQRFDIDELQTDLALGFRSILKIDLRNICVCFVF